MFRFLDNTEIKGYRKQEEKWNRSQDQPISDLMAEQA